MLRRGFKLSVLELSDEDWIAVSFLGATETKFKYLGRFCVGSLFSNLFTAKSAAVLSWSRELFVCLLRIILEMVNCSLCAIMGAFSFRLNMFLCSRGIVARDVHCVL